MATLQIISRTQDIRQATPVVLVVDDDRQTLEAVTRAATDLDIVVRARGLDAALDAATAEPPTVAILAIDPGNQRALPLAQALRRRFGTVAILVGSQLASQHASAVASLDPAGFLCKPLRVEQIQATLRLALKRRATESGHASADGAARTDLVHALRQIAAVVNGTGVVDLPREATDPPALPAALRPREQEIVSLLYAHYRVPAIAAQLGISPDTVRNHLKNIFRRLGVHSQQELLEHLRSAPGKIATTSPMPSLHAIRG